MNEDGKLRVILITVWLQKFENDEVHVLEQNFLANCKELMCRTKVNDSVDL